MRRKLDLGDKIRGAAGEDAIVKEKDGQVVFWFCRVPLDGVLPLSTLTFDSGRFVQVNDFVVVRCVVENEGFYVEIRTRASLTMQVRVIAGILCGRYDE